MDFRAATRRTYITKAHLKHTRSGDDCHPLAITRTDAIDEAWSVWLISKSGLLPERIGLHIFDNEEEAKNFLDKHPVGSEMLDLERSFFNNETITRRYVERLMDRQPELLFNMDAIRRDNHNSQLDCKILADAGLQNDTGPTKIVTDYLGDDRILILKNKHSDQWKIAAIFEYCRLILPDSSPAYMASVYQFSRYINGDLFSAGYVWRELELLVDEVEVQAVRAIEMRKRAGAAGSQRSAMARNKRRRVLMEAMADIVARNPDIAKLGHKAVATLAVSDSASKNPTLWRQGKGQADEYVGEIRRGEAGAELQAKFYTLFPQKPLKRLR